MNKCEEQIHVKDQDTKCLAERFIFILHNQQQQDADQSWVLQRKPTRLMMLGSIQSLPIFSD